MTTIEAGTLLRRAIEGQRTKLAAYEQPSEALTLETVRTLDDLFCRELFEPARHAQALHHRFRSLMGWGVNHALARILPSELTTGMFHLFPSDTVIQSHADAFIFGCGILQIAQRLEGWLGEELVDATVRRHKLPNAPEIENVLVLKAASRSLYDEEIGRSGLKWASDVIYQRDSHQERELERRHLEILPDLERRVDVYGGWGIAYSTSKEIDAYFLDWGKLYLRRIFGQDMIGPDDVLGGVTFERYLDVLASLSGRAQKHICYAAILKGRHPKLHIRNLLTTFAPTDMVIRGIAEQLDADSREVEHLLRSLTLDPSNKTTHTGGGETV
jgi:hypothetical protein